MVDPFTRPERTAPRLGSGFLRSGIHPGASPPVGFASTSSRCVRLRRTALRAHPRMNTSTQPSEGAGGSRSRAAGELTLGLLSGEERLCTPTHCGGESALRLKRTPPVGAAAGCDLLILKNQSQKIAACGRSYRGRIWLNSPPEPHPDSRSIHTPPVPPDAPPAIPAAIHANTRPRS